MEAASLCEHMCYALCALTFFRHSDIQRLTEYNYSIFEIAGEKFPSLTLFNVKLLSAAGQNIATLGFAAVGIESACVRLWSSVGALAQCALCHIVIVSSVQHATTLDGCAYFCAHARVSLGNLCSTKCWSEYAHVCRALSFRHKCDWSAGASACADVCSGATGRTCWMKDDTKMSQLIFKDRPKFFQESLRFLPVVG